MKRRRGFTLIEVLVALVILGIVGGVVVTSLISSIRLNAEGRVRERAITATHSWIDRFQSKSLDFQQFTGGKTYPYGYDYASDPTFVAAGDPNPASLNSEWSGFKFSVLTKQVSEDPVIWNVAIETYYRKPAGGEGHFTVQTLIKQ